jgi:uncharacterized membrane protein YgcG
MDSLDFLLCVVGFGAGFLFVRTVLNARARAKRRVADALERTRILNAEFEAREAAREAERYARTHALIEKASLAGLGGGSRPQMSAETSRKRRDEENAAINARYQNAASPSDMYPIGYNFAPAPAASHAPGYHGGGGSFDGGGASGDWGSSSSSSSSDSCSSSSSDSSSSSSDSGSCSSSSD